MYSRRREAPLGLLSWGSNPYPYAPDGSDSALRGTGGGGANLESGLDNGPVMEGVPFNVSGLYLQDEYDAGYTGERNLCRRTTLCLWSIDLPFFEKECRECNLWITVV